MDTRRRVRTATHDDVAGIVALVRRHDPVNRSRAELVVNRLLAGPSIALVFDDPHVDGIAGVLLASPAASGTAHWSVDAFEVRHRGETSTTLPTMLSAAADRLFRSGVDTLVVPVDPANQQRSAVLEASGLEPASWLLWRSGASWEPTEPIRYEPGLPLPHLHGLRPHAPQVPVRAEGATAMMASVTLPFGCRRSLEVIDVFDPLVATDAASLRALVDSPTPRRATCSDASLGVMLGHGEEPLSDALRQLGFRPMLDWWALHLLG